MSKQIVIGRLYTQCAPRSFEGFFPVSADVSKQTSSMLVFCCW